MTEICVASKDTAPWPGQFIDIQQERDIERLNTLFKELSPEERIRAFYENASLRSRRVILTSSFGTTAVYLLHLFYRQNIRQEVIFLDTGFHFRETLAYKEVLVNNFDLKVKTLQPEDWKHAFAREQQLWNTDPDLCCSVNKVEPLLQIKKSADIWISGLMGWQTSHRRNLNIFQPQEGVLKFYPLIDVAEETVRQYMKKWDLPVHPLKPLGYESIGCRHCTFKGKGRQGRWLGKSKTECGLHR